MFERAMPPPAELPAARIVLAGTTNKVQEGTLFAYTWILGGQARIVDPALPLPWPAAAAVPLVVPDEVLVRIDTVPVPSWVDVRVYSTVGADTAPIGTPLQTVTCDPKSGESCATTGPDGVRSVRVKLTRGGPRMITVNAAWPVARKIAQDARMPGNALAVRSAWLFRLDT
jgi:hypothetical protein